jgi:hypothetical protein
MNWTKYPGNPVLDKRPSGDWDDVEVTTPNVLYGDDGNYYMWYSGTRSVGSNFRIGYATSSDGVIWIKSLSNPVLDKGLSGSWEDVFVAGPSVLYKDGTYHM